MAVGGMHASESCFPSPTDNRAGRKQWQYVTNADGRRNEVRHERAGRSRWREADDAPLASLAPRVGYRRRMEQVTGRDSGVGGLAVHFPFGNIAFSLVLFSPSPHMSECNRRQRHFRGGPFVLGEVGGDGISLAALGRDSSNGPSRAQPSPSFFGKWRLEFPLSRKRGAILCRSREKKKEWKRKQAAAETRARRAERKGSNSDETGTPR